MSTDQSNQHITPPNSEWTYGQKVESSPEGKEWVEAGEKAGWTVVDTATEDSTSVYKLMISGIIPRPIAFVSSLSADGVENLAPFSWFNMVTNSPPLVSISITNLRKPDQFHKDTAANIKATKGFVVNLLSEPFIQQANSACIDAPPDVSEWELSGLTRAPSVHVKPSRVKESAFSMECELFQFIDITNPATDITTTSLVLGHVKYIHVRNDILRPKTERGAGLVDPVKFKPAFRLGDITYARLGDMYRIERPSWASEAEKIKEALQGSGEHGSDARARV